MFAKSSYQYNLPKEKIAKHPLPKRSDSKILVVGKQLIESQFRKLCNFIEEGDLLIFNNTKVIPARMFAKKKTGGGVEIFIEQILTDNTAYARCRIKNPQIGMSLQLGEAQDKVTIEKRQGEGFMIKSSTSIAQLITNYGEMPIPPYLERDAQERDKTEYQTVYAKNAGAVAAPTAGLHFDDELFEKIVNKQINTAEISLHVGAGTFLPLREDDIRNHKIHREYFIVEDDAIKKIIATKNAGKKVIAVGTTTLRALESIALLQNINAGNWQDLQAYSGWSEIYITPGFEFKIFDRLITNFHQPASTLLILVSAFAGFEKINNAYRYALKNDYRFLSFGDGMILDKA